MAKRSTAELKEDAVEPLHPMLAEHLVAHGQAEKQLLAMIEGNRLPHAILLTGPRGIGKATLAYRLARFLLAPRETGGLFGDATSPESLHIPPAHPTFRRMAAGAHPDFLVLEAEDIKIEEARSVASFLALTPAESEWRVVIIDCADAMNRNAANALLKTLEEPPARALLILVSHNPGTLLATIRSRCRNLRMAPLSGAEFARVTGGILPELSPAQAQVWALLSGGSPGVALSLYQAKADGIYKDLVERLSAGDILKNHAFADRFNRKDAGGSWGVLARLYLWLLNRVITAGEGHEVYTGEHEALARLRAQKPVGFWLELWERAGKLLADTERLHLDKKQTLLTLLRAAAE